MKRRIFKNMCFLAGSICFLTYTLIFICFNYIYSNQNEKHVQDEAYYFAEGLNVLESFDERIAFCENMQDITPTRITWVDIDGSIIYDSKTQADLMDNHMNRPEILQAFKQGSSSDVRRSETVQQRTYYYAVLLDDGTVVRLSISTQSVYALFVSMLPLLVILFIVFLGIIMIAARTMTNAIVRPINNLDIVKPEENDTYEELQPLLSRLRNQNQERLENERIRREFSANVSHELKTPLTSISGYAELMKNKMVNPEDVPSFSEKIYKEAARLIGLVNDIIKISRLDERKIGIEKEPVNLISIAEDVAARLENICQKYKVSMSVDGESTIVNAVPQMMDELLYNLCENAIKYNRPGGNVFVRIYTKELKTAIEIEDTGIGIPKEDIEHVFERFYRVDKSHSRQTGGTGLGLAIVKHVVEYHDGIINLDSELDKGTKITIII